VSDWADCVDYDGKRDGPRAGATLENEAFFDGFSGVFRGFGALFVGSGTKGELLPGGRIKRARGAEAFLDS
jgi:hypothetical protein